MGGVSLLYESNTVFAAICSIKTSSVFCELLAVSHIVLHIILLQYSIFIKLFYRLNIEGILHFLT